MANKKISQLTALGSNFAATDLFEISKDVGAGAFESKKITGAEMIASIGGATDLNGLNDVEVVNGSTPLAFSMFLSNGTSPGAAPQHGTLVNASRNLAIMAGALASVTSGDSNICIGFYAGNALTTQVGNVLIGDSAGQLITDANAKTTAIGYGALDAATTGTQNTALGYNAGSAVTLGDFNTLLGSGSGDGLQNADKNIMIGYEADGAANSDYQIAIGSQVATTQTASLSLGQSGAILLHGDFAAAGQTKLGVNLGNTWTAPTANLHVKGQGTGTDVALLVEDSVGDDLLKVLDNGSVTVNNAYTFPVADGGANEVLQTDGAGNLSFAAVSGGASALGDLSDATTPATSNLGLGADALAGIVAGGNYNVGVGIDAGKATTTGDYNVYVGFQSGLSKTTVGRNTGVGYKTLRSGTSGQWNSALGYEAFENVTGSYNLGLGASTVALTAGNYQIAVGYNVATTQSSSLALGRVGQLLLHGDFATADETKLGINLGTTFTAPTATLHVKGQGTTYATTNLLIENSNGDQIMKLTDVGDSIAIGKRALDSITPGSASFNIGLGTEAGTSLTTGDNNVMLGNQAGAALIGGSDNICIGYYTGGLGLTSASYNVLIGRSAGISNNGASNVAVGYETIRLGTSVSECVAIGYYALRAVTGDNNIGIGYKAGDNITSGTDNIIIGTDLDASSATVVAELNIGGHIIGSMAAADRYTKFAGQVYTETSALDVAAPDFTTGNVQTVTLTSNVSPLPNPTNIKDGATYILIIKQDGVGSRTMTFGTSYKWEGGTAPTLSTGANAVDILTFISDGTNMYGTAALNFS